MGVVRGLQQTTCESPVSSGLSSLGRARSASLREDAKLPACTRQERGVCVHRGVRESACAVDTFDQHSWPILYHTKVFFLFNLVSDRCVSSSTFSRSQDMDHLSRLDKYFKEKERRRLDSVRNDMRAGLPEMTKDEIRLSCLENNGYDSPELNDKLYLHFRGFKKIENLDLYTGCRAIWLDSNGFSEIENLDKMVDLRCLYLAKNLISEIKGLDCLKQLVTIDLSNNRITMVSNLSCCPLLETVNLSRNALATVESVAHFKECSQLRNIDLTMNRLECDENFLPLLSEIPALVTLSLNGNELTKLPSFRKRLIATLPKLGYLDRPVDEVERLCAEAFVSGGVEAEKVARDAHRDSVQQKRLDEMAQFRAWQEEQSKLRAQAKAEGRSLIREFTPEEVAERQAEAKRDAEEERKILGLGVDKLAARYWQLGGEESLDEAGRQLLEEEERMKKMHRDRLLEEEERAARVVQLPDEVAAVAACTPPSPSAFGTEETKSFTPDFVQLPPAPVATLAQVPPPAHVLVPPAPPRASDEEDEEELDPREEALRQKRIADSMEIFKRQLAVSKASGKKLTLGTGISDLLHENGATETTFYASDSTRPKSSSSSTWDAAGVVESREAEQDEPRELTYWTEEMDILLAKQVRAKMFDFVAVAEAIVAAATGPDSKISASMKRAGIRPKDVTAEACRLRWADLDAEKWSAVGTDVTPMDTNFAVYVTSSMISSADGHGGQPSYSALATLAAGSLPTYLTAPTSFPSVADIDDDDNDEDDEAVEIYAVPPPPIPVDLASMD